MAGAESPKLHLNRLLKEDKILKGKCLSVSKISFCISLLIQPHKIVHTCKLMSTLLLIGVFQAEKKEYVEPRDECKQVETLPDNIVSGEY